MYSIFLTAPQRFSICYSLLNLLQIMIFFLLLLLFFCCCCCCFVFGLFSFFFFFSFFLCKLRYLSPTFDSIILNKMVNKDKYIHCPAFGYIASPDGETEKGNLYFVKRFAMFQTCVKPPTHILSLNAKVVPLSIMIL